MLLRWRLKSILANEITFPTVYNLLGLHKTPHNCFACEQNYFNTHAESVAASVKTVLQISDQDYACSQVKGSRIVTVLFWM